MIGPKDKFFSWNEYQSDDFRVGHILVFSACNCHSISINNFDVCGGRRYKHPGLYIITIIISIKNVIIDLHNCSVYLLTPPHK